MKIEDLIVQLQRIQARHPGAEVDIDCQDDIHWASVSTVTVDSGPRPYTSGYGDPPHVVIS